MMQRFGDVYRSQVARAIGLPTSRLYSISRKRKNLALVSSQVDELVAFERDVLQILFADKGNQPQHLAAVVPDLLEKVEAAREGIAIFRDVLDDQEKLDSEIESLCAASQRANSQTRTIRLWMPELLRWLRQNRAVLYRKPSSLALEFVAHDFDVKSWLIRDALAATPTPLETIRTAVNVNLRARPEKKKRGRGRRPDTHAKLRALAAFDLLQENAKAPCTQVRFSALVYPDKPASADATLRRFKSENREKIARAKAKMRVEDAEEIISSFLPNDVYLPSL
jgi:hypothetical protein